MCSNMCFRCTQPDDRALVVPMISFKRPKLLAKSLMLLDSAFTIQAQERAEKKRQEYEQIKEYNNEHFNSYYQVPQDCSGALLSDCQRF